jgi:hypothetical protein
MVYIKYLSHKVYLYGSEKKKIFKGIVKTEISFFTGI